MMEGREFAIFDVSSDLAHFRRPYVTTTALTFPIPPRTALCGLVGAILGQPKNEVLSNFVDQDAVFGLLYSAPVSLTQYSFNLVDTKDNPTFRLKSENPHTQVRYECIRSPRYTVAFGHPTLTSELVSLLAEGRTVYTPCLGLAWMIARVEGVRSERGEHVDAPATMPYRCLVRTADLDGDIEWDNDAVYQRLRMPAEMQPDRQVTRYEEYIVETSGRAIKCKLKHQWRLASGDCFSAM